MKRLENIVGLSAILLFTGWAIWILSGTPPKQSNVQKRTTQPIPAPKAPFAQKPPEPQFFYIDTLLKGRFKHPYDLAVDTLNDLLKMYAGRDTAFVEMGPYEWANAENSIFGSQMKIRFWKGRLFTPDKIHAVGVGMACDSLYFSVWRQDSNKTKRIFQYNLHYWAMTDFSNHSVQLKDLNGDNGIDILLNLGNSCATRYWPFKIAFFYQPSNDSFTALPQLFDFKNAYFDPKRRLVFDKIDGGLFNHQANKYRFDSKFRLIRQTQLVWQTIGNVALYQLYWHDGKKWRLSLEKMNPTPIELKAIYNRFDTIYEREVGFFYTDELKKTSWIE